MLPFTGVAAVRRRLDGGTRWRDMMASKMLHRKSKLLLSVCRDICRQMVNRQANSDDDLAHVCLDRTTSRPCAAGVKISRQFGPQVLSLC